MFPGRARRKAPLPADIPGMRSIPVMTAARVKGTPYFIKVPELTS